MIQEEVNRCQIQEWFPKFQLVTFPTIIRELPESFVQYLLQQVENRGHISRLYVHINFPEVESMVDKLLRTSHGEAFLKLNWSSPKDYALLTPHNTPRCTSVQEIIHLLTTSKSLLHDLHHAYDKCSDKTSSRPPKFFLALRRWRNIKPEMEFRCFVKAHCLVAISQRNIHEAYPSIVGLKKGLKEDIKKFFGERIYMNFESENYTFDVYIEKDRRITLMDFNPWSEITHPRLFTWNQLEVFAKHYDVVFRTMGHQGAYTDYICECKQKSSHLRNEKLPSNSELSTLSCSFCAAPICTKPSPSVLPVTIGDLPFMFSTHSYLSLFNR